MKTKIVMGLLAGATLLAACKNSAKYSTDEAAKMDSAQMDSAQNVKLVKTGDIRFKVKDVKQATGRITKLTALCGGMVMHNEIHSNVVSQQNIPMPNDSLKKLTVYNSTAEMTIKVPAEDVNVVMDAINDLGDYVDNSKIDVEDRSLDYLSEKLKAQNRTTSVKLRRHIKLTQRGADSILQLNDDAVDRKISNMRTDEAVKYSVLTLSLYQDNTVTREMVLNDDPSTYKSPLSLRAGTALANGWNFFSMIVIGLLNLWVFILLGIGAWIGVVVYKKRKGNKTMANSQ